MPVNFDSAVIETDVLIIGSGLAGLMLALRLQTAGARVVLASKANLDQSNSTFAQGGVAAVTGANPFDSPEVHLADTIKAGAGLADEGAAREIIYGGGRLISELDALGVAFDKNGNGKLDLALEGGHKQARVLHSKDTTGRSITTALTEKVRAASGHLKILENCFALDLIVSEGSCGGAVFIFEGRRISVQAQHTVLATGGLGQVFERTTNPAVATGDGVAIAYRAGAELGDMEFVQFHPTALRKDGAPAFLITEAARGAGAILLDHKGRRFVSRFHQDGELATRDIVARAIHAVMSEYGLNHVYLDLRPIGAEQIAERFPNVVKTCRQYGVDVFNEAIPIAPAAHYMMGGVRAATNGRTSLPGLYAIGECACTGLHGANRLASNSLLEAGVMALNLADKLAAAASFAGTRSLRVSASRAATALMVPENLDQFRTLMYRYAGLVRSQSGLTMLLNAPAADVQERLTIDHYRAANIYQAGKLIARAALLRKESRGAHLRDDFALADDQNFAGHLWLSKRSYGWAGRDRL